MEKESKEIKEQDNEVMSYPTDLTDEQWDLIKGEIPRKRMGRRAKVEYRDVINGILYVAKTGCQWEMLPKEYPPKSTVHRYFLIWQFGGVWERIQHKLLGLVRQAADRKTEPTAAIIDAQTVKSAVKGGSGRAIVSDMMAGKRSKAASGTGQ